MQEVLPNIYQAYTDLSVGPIKFPAAMFGVKSADAFVLIAPFDVDGSERQALEAIGTPTHIVIDTETHERDADLYRQRYDARVLAHQDVVPKIDCAVDETFVTGDRIPGDLTVVGVEGTRPGESLFLHPEPPGVLIVGDALMDFKPHERGFFMRLMGFPVGLGKMPGIAIDDKKKAHQSYLALLDLNFDCLLLSHSQNTLSNAKETLRRVLEAS